MTKDIADLCHVLVVDDDERLRTLLSRFLKEHGFVVSVADDTTAARQQLSNLSFDVIVLDIMMPGETGLSFTNWLRAQNGDLAKVPVLLLSAKGEIEDRIQGLELGADDFLPKPFEPRELVARLNSLVRRAATGIEKTIAVTEVTFGDFSYNTQTLALTRNDQPVKLAPIEIHLMTKLSLAAGEAVDREDLAASAPIPSTPRSIDVQVGRLRRKIETDSKIPQFIHTVRGTGYRLLIGRGTI